MKKILILTILMTTGTPHLTPASVVCDGAPSFDEAVADATLIALGKVKAITPLGWLLCDGSIASRDYTPEDCLSGFAYRVRFRVKDTWKGEETKQVEFTAVRDMRFNQCPPTLRKGRSALVLLPARNGEYWVDSRTGIILYGRSKRLKELHGNINNAEDEDQPLSNNRLKLPVTPLAAVRVAPAT